MTPDDPTGTLTPITSERQHDGARGTGGIQIPEQAGSPPSTAARPLRWPAATTAVKARRALTEKVSGFVCSPDWLPSDLGDEGLEALRQQHNQLLEAAAGDIDRYEGSVIHALTRTPPTAPRCAMRCAAGRRRRRTRAPRRRSVSVDATR